MRRVMIFVLLVLVSIGIRVTGQNHRKQSKEEERQEQYRETLALVNKGDFIFEARRALPQSGPSVDMTTNYGFIEVSPDSTVEGNLPFFGRAWHVEYGGRGGIRFFGVPREVEISPKPDKKKIIYSFRIKDKDFFRVRMDIGYSGDASVSINSNNRSHISYLGSLDRSPTSE